jgi:hypothetical protein
MPPCDEPILEASTPRGHLHADLGRLIARLADEPDPAIRTDLADHAYDVLAVLERLDGSLDVAHPRGLRLIA